MLQIGNIVFLLPDNLEPQSETNPFLIIGCSDSCDSLTLVHLTKDIDHYKSKRFTEIITSMDLEDGTLKENHIAIIDRIITVNSDSLKKVARLNKDKLDRVLRIFSHYAGYSHYKGTSINPNPRKQIPHSGKVLDEHELFGMIDASLDMWLTAGRFHDDFEKGDGIQGELFPQRHIGIHIFQVHFLFRKGLGNKRKHEGNHFRSCH